MNSWFDSCRYVFLKSELIGTYDTINEYNELTNISEYDCDRFVENRKNLTASELQSYVDELFNKENAGKYLYLFMVDMDGLKYINDNFGHVEGDFAIVTLANALGQLKTDHYVCSRVGGDEFICSYVENTEQLYTSESFSSQLESLILNIEYANCKPYPISASVGMIMEQISEELDLDSMINHADSIMYAHKMDKKARKTSD